MLQCCRFVKTCDADLNFNSCLSPFHWLNYAYFNMKDGFDAKKSSSCSVSMRLLPLNELNIDDK